ncbi:MAG: TolC family protein [Gammaproteobacteria bacterium]|nr:TolC family protein [Gammaproteobacteria bacterium]
MISFYSALRQFPAAILICVCALGVVSVPAAQSDNAALGASMPPLIEWVDNNNAELAALRHEIEAAKARAQAAGALEDPMFRMELQDIDPDNPQFLPGQVGATKYTVLQNFPLWGKRDLRHDAALSAADEALGRLRATSAELHARVKSAFARYFYVHHAQRLTADVLSLLQDLERIAQTRYSTGLAPQQDVIKAQTEQTALRLELLSLQAEKRQAQARLNALLNRSVAEPLGDPVELRAPPPSIDTARLEERARQGNPQLMVTNAQIQGAQSNDRLVEKNRYPDLTVGVSPIQREDRIDSWELMFEVNIPLQQSARRGQESEAGAMLAAAQQRVQAILAQVSGEIQGAAAGFEAAREQEQLLRSTLLPQAEATFSSALASYQTGKVDFATLLEAQRSIRAARIGLLKARVEVELRLAEIERLTGENL